MYADIHFLRYALRSGTFESQCLFINNFSGLIYAFPL